MNIAYIDGANLHKSQKLINWKLDYRRFRVWLKDKFGIDKAYIFLGYVAEYKYLYEKLTNSGFVLSFKEITRGSDGQVKGNCDADLVVKVMSDSYENRDIKVLLVSSDGDYAGLVKFLLEKDRDIKILSPYQSNRCSILLKRSGVKIFYLTDQIEKLSVKEKTPDEDRTS